MGGAHGLRLLPQVAEVLSQPKPLAFTNTRSQAERWYDAIREARPDWKDKLVLHHGSVDRALRATAEAVLATANSNVLLLSSLDLGVDFGPVEQVLQIGSPKGIARILQRAGKRSCLGQLAALFVFQHMHWNLSSAAARLAASAGSVEPRRPLTNALDCLSQHIVTVGAVEDFVNTNYIRKCEKQSRLLSLTHSPGRAMDSPLAADMLSPPTLTTAESRNDLGDGTSPAPHWLVGTE